MKVINRSRILTILRTYFFVFLATYTIFLTFAISSQERIDLFSEIMPPELLGLQIFSIAIYSALAIFSFFTFFAGVSIYKVLSSEYFRVWGDFIEGPNDKGERVLMSFGQISYMGRDLLGQFSLVSEVGTMILPGKLSVSSERIIGRSIRAARLKNNLQD
ncbi:MAG: hypothetical protein BM556_05065 [Bacteriovorax sp. MedPE-SWde]|nr:MAG: hypothetical protein BM556_05065 [Bacteriovorax sp. MedPE-SWde]